MSMTFPTEHQRKRHTIAINGNAKHDEPETLSRNAAAVAQGIEDLQKDRDRLRHELDTALARIEQFESNETRLLSDLEGERARTAAAKDEAEQARTKQAQLETVITSIVNMGTDALRIGTNMPMIELAAIIADQKAQPRTAILVDKVAEYTEDMERGDKFPPLVVFSDGERYWLADGFHRFYAAPGAGKSRVMCEVHKGGQREAILYSCGANSAHGLRRTNLDKQWAVAKLLEDDIWGKWTDEEIARHAAVTQQYVSKTRKEMEASLKIVVSDIRTRIDKHGNVGTMNTANIGRKPEPGEGKIIADTLKDMERCIDFMPAPAAAVAAFPDDQRYFFPVSKLEQMAEWMTDFAAAWRARIVEKARADA